MSSRFYDYRGVVNVQTSLSAGSASPHEVITSAQTSELDFLVLSDINSFSKKSDYGGYYGHLLVLDQSEYSLLDERLLFLSTRPHPRFLSPGESQVFFADLLSQKNVSERSDLVFLEEPYREDQATWTGQFQEGVNGLEILNPKVMAERAWKSSKLSVFWSFFSYPFSPLYSILRLYEEPTEELKLWDETNLIRPLVGFAGVNANARAVPMTGYLFKFPTYELSFSLFTNHLLLTSELTGHYTQDRKKILQALQSGQFYFSTDLLGDPRGFESYVKQGTRIWPMGSQLNLKSEPRLIVHLKDEPRSFFEIVIYRNGKRIANSNSTEMEYAITQPGVYRAVVRVSPFLPVPDGKKWIPWIFTNAYRVLK